MASAAETDAPGATREVALHRGLQAVIAEREADIIDEMVLTWRSNKASFEYLTAKVAAISELRRLEASLDRDARMAIAKTTPGNTP